MDSFDWKLLNSKSIHQDNWVSLRADSCEMPNGSLVEPYYVLDYPTWVNAIALTEKNEVILVKQYRHGIQKTILELPCGGMDAQDENPKEAIKRELLEETGYLFKKYEPLGVLSPNAATHSNQTHCFLATDVISIDKQKLDSSEQIEIVFVPFEQFITMAKNGEFHQALHVGAIFYLLCKLGKI